MYTPHPLLKTCRGRLLPSPARGEGTNEMDVPLYFPSLDGRGLRGGGKVYKGKTYVITHTTATNNKF